MDWTYHKEVLSRAGVEFDKGLTNLEFENIQEKYGFIFPPDLREFLASKMPVSKSWMNWRDPKQIEKMLVWPLEGIQFDIEHNAFWMDEWGKKPSDLHLCFAIAKKEVEKAPKLIPIFSHRFIPSEPNEEGNPVFSVYQTDIIFYGKNLIDYIEHEYAYHFDKKRSTNTEEYRNVRFWTELVFLNG